MAAVIVTCDICQKDKDCSGLIKAIESYGIRTRVTDSSWIIISDSSVFAMRRYFQKHADANDRIFVAGLSNEAAWVNTICDQNWLKCHL
ncbi:CRISPR-associated protein Cas2 [Candidatus Formimonas warabiya]|uniref:Uncharacterized protein n=1 Tax=Formimonas warabiya TaxID=1761012 RepID=A0A3G1KX28_FORW1|nr:CRISPR-associated protein Cas2 [Candidatus Formimonas warabiya]ATW27034.1 hypothetical protein DCMF_21740 [Candidatus Formimonas warabiya]